MKICLSGPQSTGKVSSYCHDNTKLRKGEGEIIYTSYVPTSRFISDIKLILPGGFSTILSTGVFK